MSSSHNAERINVLYFIDRSGYVIVAPDQSHPCPQGYEKRWCRTLREVDSLTRRLNTQDRNMFAHLMERDRQQIVAQHARIKSKLNQRLLAIDCGPAERLFIQSAYKYMDRKEAELLKCDVRGYFHQREFDSPGSDPVEIHGRQLEATKPKLSDRLASLMTS